MRGLGRGARNPEGSGPQTLPDEEGLLLTGPATWWSGRRRRRRTTLPREWLWRSAVRRRKPDISQFPPQCRRRQREGAVWTGHTVGLVGTAHLRCISDSEEGL